MLKSKFYKIILTAAVIFAVKLTEVELSEEFEI